MKSWFSGVFTPGMPIPGHLFIPKSLSLSDLVRRHCAAMPGARQRAMGSPLPLEESTMTD